MSLLQLPQIKIGRVLARKIKRKHFDDLVRSKIIVAPFVVVALFLLLFGVSKFMNMGRQVLGESDVADESGKNKTAHLVIDAGTVLGPMAKPWQNLAQGGESKDWDLGQIRQEVRNLQPRYIRIDHIYDFYEIVKGEPGNLQFDFSKLDKVINEILMTGAKPYISLSYMPPVIADGDVIEKPKRWDDWRLTVRKTIEYISGAKGIPDVYYEVWNEPDSFGQWELEGEKNYLELYRYAAQGATDAQGVQAFKIGGPATTGLYKGWFNNLVGYCRENNLRLDFYSWHRYSNDVHQFVKDAQNAQEWSAKFPGSEENLELHLTEWGHDSDHNPGYDSYYGAAHTAAASILMVNKIREAHVFEIQDGKDPEGEKHWGRWGIMVHQDFGSEAKPRYYALDMLNQLYEERLKLIGENYYIQALASRDENGKIRIIAVNFDPQLNHQETVPITIVNLDNGIYLMEEKYLDGKSRQRELVAEKRRLDTTIKMKVNDVVMLTLEK